MAKTTTVALRDPIIGHGAPITEIVLRPPNLIEYARIGDPSSAMPSAEGRYVYVEHDAAIAAYVEACIVKPEDKLLLVQVQLGDAMRIKEAILDFFGAARLANMSQTSPTSSSSTSN